MLAQTTPPSRPLSSFCCCQINKKRVHEWYIYVPGHYGQLGHGDTVSKYTPSQVQFFSSLKHKAKTLCCGDWSTFVITAKWSEAVHFAEQYSDVRVVWGTFVVNASQNYMYQATRQGLHSSCRLFLFSVSVALKVANETKQACLWATYM